MLSYIASIYDPLGIISASQIIGKLIYLELCDVKIPWDEEIPGILKTKFKQWVQDISSNKTVLPRAIPFKLETVTTIDLHVIACLEMLLSLQIVQQFTQ